MFGNVRSSGIEEKRERRDKRRKEGHTIPKRERWRWIA
jgi:hypothetical protein